MVADPGLSIFGGQRSVPPAAVFSSTLLRMAGLSCRFSPRSLKQKWGDEWWVRRDQSRKTHKRSKGAALTAEAGGEPEEHASGEVTHAGHSQHPALA